MYRTKNILTSEIKVLYRSLYLLLRDGTMDFTLKLFLTIEKKKVRSGLNSYYSSIFPYVYTFSQKENGRVVISSGLVDFGSNQSLFDSTISPLLSNTISLNLRKFDVGTFDSLTLPANVDLSILNKYFVN